MKFFAKHLPVFFILLLIVVGCSSVETIESTRVSPANIYAIYTVRANRTETVAVAVFREKNSWGATISLNEPNKIEYNGTEMPKKSASFLKGTNYVYSSGTFPTANEFVYTDADANVYRNSISFQPIEIETPTFDLPRSQPSVVRLSRPVRASEKISINLNSSEENSAAAANKPSTAIFSSVLPVNLNEERTALIINPADLRKFARGNAVLKITVKGKGTMAEATAAGGEIGYVYESEANVNVF